MKNFGIKLSLYLNYFVFAALLNSVGILIQKSINNYGIVESSAAILEPIKDLTIAFVSFFVGSLMPRLGYKKGFLLSLAIVFFACLNMYYGNNFWSVKILFFCTGFSFAIVKVSVLALIGEVAKDSNDHKSIMSSLESVFMIGILSAYLGFPLFFKEDDPDAWLRVYLVLAAAIAVVFIILAFINFDITKPVRKSSLEMDFVNMLKLLALPMILLFAVFALMYVMTEQSIMSWLPTFNEKVLHLSEKLSVRMSALLMLSFALGRFLTGVLVKRINYLTLIMVSLVCAALLVVLVLPQAQNIHLTNITSLEDVPLVGFVFPMIGLFLAPIYPLINSTVISATDKSKHSAIAGILTFFSAIGGTVGSLAVGRLFEVVGGEKAFYFSLLPISFLMVTVYFLHKIINTKKEVF